MMTRFKRAAPKLILGRRAKTSQIPNPLQTKIYPQEAAQFLGLYFKIG